MKTIARLFPIFACAFAGCAAKPDPIPHYPLNDLQPSLDAIRDRLARLSTVNGEATILMTSAKGDTIHLDGVYLLSPPENARLRAWKLGTAVFDLTLTDGKAWAYLPREEAKPAAPKLRQSLGEWLALIGGGEILRDSQAMFSENDTIKLVRSQDGGFLTCIVDRVTLTPREYSFVDGENRERFKLTLSNYRPAADGQVWPYTIVAKSDNGTVEIDTKSVDVNGQLPAVAFKPPARAEALP